MRGGREVQQKVWEQHSVQDAARHYQGPAAPADPVRQKVWEQQPMQRYAVSQSHAVSRYRRSLAGGETYSADEAAAEAEGLGFLQLPRRARSPRPALLRPLRLARPTPRPHPFSPTPASVAVPPPSPHTHLAGPC